MTKETKKKTTKKQLPTRKYTVFYSIGNDPEFFIAHGTDYKLTTLDIKSNQTADTFSFPVVFVIDAEMDTLDIIPMNSVGNIRYNYGFMEEATKYKTEFEALQRKMKESAEDGGQIIEGEPVAKVLPVKKNKNHDVQYG